MASQPQTSCRASWWTIGVCILAAALLPGEPLPAGPPGRRWALPGRWGGGGGPGQPRRRAAGCRWGKGVREVLRSGGEGWGRLFGVRAQGWSRCGSICVRVGESRGRFHLWLGEEQHGRLFWKQLQAVGSGVLGAEAVCLLFGSSNV